MTALPFDVARCGTPCQLAARADAAKSGWYLMNYYDFMRDTKP